MLGSCLNGRVQTGQVQAGDSVEVKCLAKATQVEPGLRWDLKAGLLILDQSQSGVIICQVSECAVRKRLKSGVLGEEGGLWSHAASKQSLQDCGQPSEGLGGALPLADTCLSFRAGPPGSVLWLAESL